MYSIRILSLLILIFNLPALHLKRHPSHKCTFSPSWSVNITNLRVIKTIDNKEIDSSTIIEPMSQSRGLITLLTLLDTKDPLAMDQAKKLSVMYEFLKSNGLNKINFIIINDENSSGNFDELKSSLNKEVQLFQDTQSKSVKKLLDGKNYDIFVYNRCGKIAYHISYPQSLLNSTEPIVQATILATYYEDLCKSRDDCEVKQLDTGKNNTNIQLSNGTRIGRTDNNYQNENSTIDLTKERKEMTKVTENKNDINTDENRNEIPIKLNESNDLKNNTIKMSINKEDNSTQDKHVLSDKNEILKNSSTLNFTDLFVVDKNESKSNDSSYSSSLLISPWSIFKFFIFKNNSSNASNQSEPALAPRMIPSIESPSNSAIPFQNTTNPEQMNFSVLNSMNESSLQKSIDSPIKPSNTTKCTNLDGSNINCSDFTNDKMLAVRLCCLNGNNILSKGGSGFSCRKFDKQQCDVILPIIKCCLRDLSEILDDYFEKSKNEKNETTI